MPDLSIIIAFYNKIDYLKLVLAGLKLQTFKNFEVIIADDGSRDEIVAEIEKIIKSLSFNAIHLWQNDKGFRKNKVLNRAIETSNSNYLLFIDGDCIPHKEFAREHFINKKKGVCLTGRRVNLSRKTTKIVSYKYFNEGILVNNFLLFAVDGIFGESSDVEKGIYIKNSLLRKIFNKKKRGILGCNFSLFKEDILAINGFDERYVAPSIGEDSDIQFRLEKNGVQITSLNNIAVQYHLYHKPLERNKENVKLFELIKKEGLIYTPYGITKINKV